jgi:hypothetical protein
MKCIVLLLVLAACKHGSSPATTNFEDVHTTLAEDDESPHSYDMAAVQKALIAERAEEARGERLVAEAGDPDKLRIALSDLAVRRRFIRILELCETKGRLCPPRLDDPPFAAGDADPKLDVPLRFDLVSWQKVTVELHGRSCACRTLACLDSMEVTLAQLETRPTDEVQADETANLEITRARECMSRLRGKRALPKVATE